MSAAPFSTNMQEIPTITTSPPSDAPHRLVFGPGRSNWWGAVFFGVIGIAAAFIPLLAPAEKRAHEPVALWLLGLALTSPFVLFVAGFALWILRARIVAAEAGIAWRGVLGRWRMVPWSHVSDYYERLVPQGKNTFMVETSAGKINLKGIVDEAPQLEKLRDFIAEHATYAKTREWGVLGARVEDDWPQTFTYQSTDNRVLPWLMWTGVLVLPCLMLVSMALKSGGVPRLVQSMQELGPWWGLGFLVMLVLIMLAYPVMFLSMMKTLVQQTRQRQLHRITVSPDAITFEDGVRRVHAAWSEVTDYYSETLPGRVQHSRRYVVETLDGSFDFVHTLHNAGLMRHIVRQFAIGARANSWQSRDAVEQELLGGEASQWSGGVAGQGQRVFHYRTRTNRAMMWIPTALIMLPLIHIPLRQSGLANPDIGGIVGVFVVSAVITALGWWRYHKAKVLLDEEGITQHTAFGVRHISWKEVKEYGLCGEESFKFIYLRGEHSSLRFWFGISEADELMQEIARRAPDAGATGWTSHSSTHRRKNRRKYQEDGSMTSASSSVKAHDH